MDKFDKQLIENLEKKEREYDELETLLESVEIMTDNKLFQFYQRKFKKLDRLICIFKKYKQLLSEYETHIELIKLESDELIIKDLETQNEEIDEQLNEIFAKLKIEYHNLEIGDSEEILVELNYKSGDTIYLETLFNIFKTYSEDNDLVLNINKKENASIIFELKGNNVYRNLSFLSGNIKMINQGKETIIYIVVLKTSKQDFSINEEDVEIETLKSGGAGGQHINKTESAIRLVHKPTGLSVVCQDERSQLMNKKRAFENLERKIKVKIEQESKNDIIFQRKNIKNALFSSTSTLTFNFDKNNVFCNKTKKYYDLKEVLKGNLQIIWSDVIIDGEKY